MPSDPLKHLVCCHVAIVGKRGGEIGMGGNDGAEPILRVDLLEAKSILRVHEAPSLWGGKKRALG